MPVPSAISSVAIEPLATFALGSARGRSTRRLRDPRWSDTLPQALAYPDLPDRLHAAVLLHDGGHLALVRHASHAPDRALQPLRQRTGPRARCVHYKCSHVAHLANPPINPLGHPPRADGNPPLTFRPLTRGQGGRPSGRVLRVARPHHSDSCSYSCSYSSAPPHLPSVGHVGHRHNRRARDPPEKFPPTSPGVFRPSLVICGPPNEPRMTE